MIPLNSLNHIPSGETCDDRPLLGGGAVSFDGVDDYISIPAITRDVNKRYGFSIWLKIPSIGGQYIFADNGGFVFIAQGGVTRFQSNGFYPRNTDILNVVNNNEWFLFSIFYYQNGNGDEVGYFKINDTEISITGTTIEDRSYVNFLGSLTGSSSSSFNGEMYGLKEYEYDKNESSSYFDSIISSNLLNEDFVKPNYLYKLDEMNGSTAFDSSGNDNHGTIEGGASYINTTEYSFRDNLGYSDGTGIYAGVYIPRDESNIKFDVLGDSLQYKLPSCNLPV